MSCISVLVICRSNAALATSLEFAPEPVEVRIVGTIRQAVAEVETGLLPALVVLEEQFPGEASQSEIDELQRVVPLARLWRVAGPWCEGELRTSPPAPGILRSYWHQTKSRLDVEFQKLLFDKQSRSALPATVTEEEALLTLGELPTLTTPGFVFVFATERESGMALLDACGALGCRGIWAKSLQGSQAVSVNVGLCDLRPHELGDEHLIREVRQAVGEAPLLAVVGFPRPEDIAIAKRTGYCGIVSKPLELADLAWHLDRAMRTTSSVA